MNKLAISILVIIGSSLNSQAQDLISGGSNSWILHTPDDERTSLHIAPKLGSTWDWAKQTVFQKEGHVLLNGSLKYNGTHGVKLMIEKSSWPNHNILSTGWDSSNGDWTEINVPGASANSANLILNKNGNVGIGTRNPYSKLNVRGDISITGSESGANNTVGQLNFINYYTTSTPMASISIKTKALGSGVHDYTNMIFNTSHGFNTLTEKMRISSDGNVGIGTTTPDAKLSVNGSIHTKEVKVDLTGWSDFVFEEDYDLPSLKHVEEYIEENGHLEDIPSAKNVKENGILLGDMDSKLLQKIEELMLYTIDQEKKIDVQNIQIQNLLTRIEQLEKSKK